MMSKSKGCIFLNKYQCLANAKRPCDCHVLCLRLKSSQCSCVHSISDMTSFGCRDQGRDSVCSALNVNVKQFMKARVNGGTDNDSLHFLACVALYAVAR